MSLFAPKLTIARKQDLKYFEEQQFAVSFMYLLLRRDITVNVGESKVGMDYRIVKIMRSLSGSQVSKGGFRWSILKLC